MSVLTITKNKPVVPPFVPASEITLQDIALSSHKFIVGAPAGTVIADLSNTTEYATLVVIPQDGRFVINDFGQLCVGPSAHSIGTFDISVVEIWPGATGSPKKNRFQIEAYSNLKISGEPAIGGVGIDYIFSPQVSGVTGSVTFAIDGQLPDGFTFSPVTGKITGRTGLPGKFENITIWAKDDYAAVSLTTTIIIASYIYAPAPIPEDPDDPGNPNPGDPGTLIANANFFDFNVNTVTPPADTTIWKYIRPVAQGSGDGSSWANAGSLGNIASFINAANGAGIHIYLRADEGNYSISSYQSITKSNFIVEGVDVNLNPLKAVFAGTRRDENNQPWVHNGDPDAIYDVTTFVNAGNESFRLNAGCARGVFKNIRFEHCGSCFIVKDSISDMVFENIEAFDVRRFFDTENALSRGRFTDIDVYGHSKPAFRFQSSTNHIVCTNCHTDSVFQDGDAFAVGFASAGTANNVKFYDCSAKNCYDIINNFGDNPNEWTAPIHYWNADGWSTEATNYNFEWIRCHAEGCTDGGYDCKGKNERWVNCTATRNKRSWRLWTNPKVLIGCTSTDPHKIDYETGGGGLGIAAHLHYIDTADIYLEDFTPVGGDPGAGNCATFLYEDPYTAEFKGILRLIDTDTSGSTAATLYSIPAGMTVGNQLKVYTPGADTEGPVVTSALATSILEETTMPQGTITSTDNAGTVIYRLSTGKDSAKFTLKRTGAWTLPGLLNFDSPLDSDANNIYEMNFIVVDERCNGTVHTLAVTVNQNPDKNILNRYISPNGAGSKNGDGWANAAPWSDLRYMVAAAAASGGMVYVAAHLGNYTISASPGQITASGTPTHPVIIRGVDASLTPARATIIGNRTNWTAPSDPEIVTDTRGWTVGVDAIQLAVGASYIEIENIDFKRVGNCVVCYGSNVGIAWRNTNSYNVRRGFTTQGNGVTNVTLENLNVVGFSKQFIQLQNDTSYVFMDGGVLNSARQDGDSFAVCVQISGTANNIHIKNVDAYYCTEKLNNITAADPDGSESFWNGDGFSSEWGNYAIIYENCRSFGHTDGGFDNKGNASMSVDASGNPVPCIQYINCWAEDCGEGFRIWSGYHLMTGSTSKNVRRRGGDGPECHFGFSSSDTRVDAINHTIIQEALGNVPYSDSSKDMVRWQGSRNTLNLTNWSITKQRATNLEKADSTGLTGNNINFYSPDRPVADFELAWKPAFAGGIALAEIPAGTVVADIVPTIGSGIFERYASGDNGLAFNVSGTTVVTSRNIKEGEQLNVGVYMILSNWLNDKSKTFGFEATAEEFPNVHHNPTGIVPSSGGNYTSIPLLWSWGSSLGMGVDYSRGMDGNDGYTQISISSSSAPKASNTLRLGASLPAAKDGDYHGELDYLLTISDSNTSVRYRINELNSSGSNVGTASGTVLNSDGTKKHLDLDYSPTRSDTAFVASTLEFSWTTGQPVSFSIRIYDEKLSSLPPTLVDVTPLTFLFLEGTAADTKLADLTNLTVGSTVVFGPDAAEDLGKIKVVDNRGSGGTCYLAVGNTATDVPSGDTEYLISGAIREILAGATNSPNDTDVVITVQSSQSDFSILKIDFSKGTVGSNTGLVDDSPFHRAVTVNTNCKVQNFATGDKRMQFIAGANYLSQIFCADSDDWAFIAAFSLKLDGVNIPSLASDITLCADRRETNGERAWSLGVNTNGTLTLALFSTTNTTATASYTLTTTGAVTAGMDADILVTRDAAGTIKIYINGVVAGSGTYTAALRNVPNASGNSQLSINGNANNGGQGAWWIQNFEIHSGVALTP